MVECWNFFYTNIGIFSSTNYSWFRINFSFEWNLLLIYGKLGLAGGRLNNSMMHAGQSGSTVVAVTTGIHNISIPYHHLFKIWTQNSPKRHKLQFIYRSLSSFFCTRLSLNLTQKRVCEGTKMHGYKSVANSVL